MTEDPLGDCDDCRQPICRTAITLHGALTLCRPCARRIRQGTQNARIQVEHMADLRHFDMNPRAWAMDPHAYYRLGERDPAILR